MAVHDSETVGQRGLLGVPLAWQRGWRSHSPILTPYVLVVTLLGCDAFRSQPLLGGWGEVAAFALLLPGVVVLLPGIYLGGAIAWQLRDSMDGHPMWPVTIVFTALFFVAAMTNGLLVSSIWTYRRSPATGR